MNTGSYLLFVELPVDLEVRLSGKDTHIKKGIYVYVGSAMKNLKQRVNRHISYQTGEYKKHWHIDYLLEQGKVISSVVIPSAEKNEEIISSFISNYFESVPGFGATDCKHVDSNLYFLKNNLKDYFMITKKVLELNCHKNPKTA
jgi:Uri superfamily endonuclease